jgi:hypothetical protein
VAEPSRVTDDLGREAVANRCLGRLAHPHSLHHALTIEQPAST